MLVQVSYIDVTVSTHLQYDIRQALNSRVRDP